MNPETNPNKKSKNENQIPKWEAASSKPIFGMRTCVVDPELAALVTKKCRNCHAMEGKGCVEKLFRCSRCHKELYCDIECQKFDWFMRHKYECHKA